MGNYITEKFFEYNRSLKDEEDKILAEIRTETGFKVKKELFRGHVQDKNKVGSIIYEGIWRKKYFLVA